MTGALVESSHRNFSYGNPMETALPTQGLEYFGGLATSASAELFHQTLPYKRTEEVTLRRLLELLGEISPFSGEHDIMEVPTSLHITIEFTDYGQTPNRDKELAWQVVECVKEFDRYIQESLLQIQESLLQKIILSLHKQGFAESATRIDELRQIEDFDSGEKPLSVESAQGFSEFIPRFSHLGEPVLGVFPEGTLSAGWRVADNRHLLIEFLDNDNVSFAIIKPDDNAPDGKFRLNGRGSQKTGLELLEKYGVTQWRE